MQNILKHKIIPYLNTQGKGSRLLDTRIQRLNPVVFENILVAQKIVCITGYIRI